VVASGAFDTALKEVLKHEGGYVNHPKDPGGMTNLGVTKRVYEEWVGYPVTETIMRSLTPAHVRTLYKVKYWDVVRGDDLPAGLDLCVFDFAVNAGPARAVRYLQLMVGATKDGKIGPNTLRQLQQYVRAHGLSRAINQYQDLREAYHKKLRTFPVFGRGWLRRIKEVRVSALRRVR
jgi:lysozyme family protein